MPNNVGSGVWAESVLVMQTPAGAVLREEALGGFLGVVAVRGVDRVFFLVGFRRGCGCLAVYGVRQDLGGS